ncbi:MAG TPA: hypothetical protein VFN21_12920 [Acidimicrobiales bacterium]|nr:hypothetical protein [Acidimicrobiales bacterium]
MRLDSADGLGIRIDDDGSVRIGIDGVDVLGRGDPGVTVATPPATPAEVTDDLGYAQQVVVDDGTVRRSLRAYVDRPLIVLRAEATKDLADLATGAFDQPSVAWPTFTPADRDPGVEPGDLTGVVFQHCEFGLPATVDASLDGFFLLPHRPPTGWPLCVQMPDGQALIVTPLDNFHEQIIGLNGGTLRCGWHGDLEEVPAGFATEFAFIGAPDIRSGIATWGGLLTDRAGTIRPGRWADALAEKVSYWTDNGAAYWYKTEPDDDTGRGLAGDVPGSIVAAVDDLRMRDVPIGAVQLDSWFYPHTELRPFDTDDWVVPPSPMVAWEAREDILPDGVAALRARLGDPPLVAHIRHLSTTAAITKDVPVYRDADTGVAVPSTPEGYEHWLDQCVAWGVETFEHDWMVEVFHTVRDLRSKPGRARAWQEGIDAAAAERGITLQWCMATPADFAQTTTLSQVTSVRTCGDHGYIATPGQLWAWFCTTNALARSLGLMPYKDVFRTDPEVAGQTGAPEALLSALSTGPVGLGDRVGRHDVGLVMATCRADGVLVKPDVPIASTSPSIAANPAFNPTLLIAETYSGHDVGRWSYVTVMHATPTDDEIAGTVRFDALGDSAPVDDVICWDWREGTAARLAHDAIFDITLDREDWAYFVLAPVLEGDVAVFGDVTKFATAGDARIEIRSDENGPNGWRLVVKGAGETVTITGWAQTAPTSPDAAVRFDAEAGIWQLDVTVGPRGWETVRVGPT